eukprot:5581905-Amphidinium_carterae.1
MKQIFWASHHKRGYVQPGAAAMCSLLEQDARGPWMLIVLQRGHFWLPQGNHRNSGHLVYVHLIYNMLWA